MEAVKGSAWVPDCGSGADGLGGRAGAERSPEEEPTGWGAAGLGDRTGTGEAREMERLAVGSDTSLLWAFPLDHVTDRGAMTEEEGGAASSGPRYRAVGG
ncbi:hypothetical protein KSP39_PZI021914 [Platanthera zijinensis]|uniref:Uncharacterized protein n=1 Tax=Platanthera zijinensis TaxID=2320716 RepID=A0AAP0AYN2_9ASPA